MYRFKFGQQVHVWGHGNCRIVGVADVSNDHCWQHFWVKTARGTRHVMASHSIAESRSWGWWMKEKGDL